ncbi:MAG TPA: proton-conducting transporter membrane subunit, partial [Gaiellaceae bacterium]|nr:proton-conducting transporter membrane subunit [Gaiellaceae bacterium]
EQDIRQMGGLRGVMPKTWLPDAMEGPTPVSALIHAATMVVAGVYLIFRMAPVFEAAPEVQDTAAILGALTLVAAGLIALVQTDIKRVIAYSTMSQIGYMFLAVGIGAYATGMFHLMTHAFFKALLFLAAGILIHALAGEQDMRKMGGLRRLAPFTYAAFLVGSLALVGVPPFSGFFSKDPILGNALDAGDLGYVLFALAAAGAFLTGLYTFRMIFLAFGGEPSDDLRARFHRHHGREGPPSMVGVVGVLAVLSAVAGFVQFAPYWTPVDDFLDPVAEPLVHATNGQETFASIVAVALGVAGIAVAWLVYSAKRIPAPRPWAALEEKLYFDSLYDAIFYRPSVATAKLLYALVEGPLVGGSLTGITSGTGRLAGYVRALQTGIVRTYVLAVAAGLAVIVLVFVSVRV